MRKGFYKNLEKKAKEYVRLKCEILEDIWKLEREKPYLKLSSIIHGGLCRDDSPLANKIFMSLEHYMSAKAITKIVKKYCNAEKYKLEECLGKLSPIEKNILELRFGFFEKPKTLEEVASTQKITKEKVRQIEFKARGKLKYHYHNYNKLSQLEEYQMIKNEKKELEEKEQKERLKKLFFEEVSDLEFSLRVSSILKNAKIEYIGDLVQKTEQDMLKYRCFGKQCLREVKERLSEYGLKLGMNHDENYKFKILN